MNEFEREALDLFTNKNYQALEVLLSGYEEDTEPVIQYIFGCLHNLGIIKEKNYDKSFEYFLASASQGCPEAERALGISYYMGHGTPINEVEGLKWVKLSVEHGLVRSLCTLAHIYMNGMGVEKDIHKGFLLYQEAAQKGDSHAVEHLIECYTNGIGTEVNLEKAEELKNQVK